MEIWIPSLNYFNDPVDVKSQKLFGVVEENQTITSQAIKESDDKETKHVELNFGDQELSYNPGDVCWIIPQNNNDETSKFLESQGLNEDDLIRIKPNLEGLSSSTAISFPPLISAKELFGYWLDTLGVPNRYFFKVMYHYTDDEIRKEKCLLLCSKTTDGKNEYYRYCHRERRTHAEILISVQPEFL